MAIIVGPSNEPAKINGTVDGDQIDAGGRNDVINGNAGADTIDGGAGADRVYGGTDGDMINGGAGRDKVYGEDGDDVVDGGGGHDRVYGGSGSDIIIGNDGNDVLYGDNPNDDNDDEGFADTFVFDDADGNDKCFDFESGIDSIELISGGTYTLVFDGNNSFLTYGSTTVTFFDEEVVASDIVFV